MTEHRTPGTTGPRALGRLKAWRYETETRLAPHVDRDWAEAFILELRLRDVPGRAVGDALAEVESHCAESGETALEAFGEPVPYATSLELDTDPVDLRMGPDAVRWTVQTLGLLITTGAAAAWQTDKPLEVTAGLLALLILLGASIVALGRAADRVLRFAVEHTVAAWALSMVHFAALVGVMLLLPQVLVSVPALPALGVGVATLVIGTVLVLLALRGKDLDDPVRASFEREGRDPEGGRRGTALLRYGPALLAPATAVVFITVWSVFG